MNEDVSTYIGRLSQEWQAEICNGIRQIVHDSIPDVQERLQYGKPHFLKNGKYICVLSVAKGWVSFTLFNAATLDVPEGLFEQSDTGERKTIKIRPEQAVDNDLLTRLIMSAAESL